MAPRIIRGLSRALRLHGGAVRNARDSVRADDTAREHREAVRSDIDALEEHRELNRR